MRRCDARRFLVNEADAIGTLTVDIVFFEPPFRNEIVYLSGDTVAYEQVAGMLERVLGRPFKTKVWTVPYLMQGLQRPQAPPQKVPRCVGTRQRRGRKGAPSTISSRFRLPRSNGGRRNTSLANERKLR